MRTALLICLLLASCTAESPDGAAEPTSRRAPAMEGASVAGRMENAMAAVEAPIGVGALARGAPTEREDAVLAYEGDLAALADVARHDGSPAVRLAAVRRLADGETPVARAALRRALEDEDPDVLAEAILALTVADDRKAVPALRRLRTHPDPEVRALADDALFALADRP